MKYDAIIVGTGAGGGTLANVLARKGLNLLVLERGGWLPREQQNWSASEVFVKNRYVSPDPWIINNKETQPGTHYYVGGATKLYGAALYRLRPEDFREMKHIDGTSPAWPISYADLEPYYSAAEQMYQVHGAHGEDPTEGPWSAQYPHPPVSHSPRIEAISGDLRAGGYHPFHAPAAVLLNEKRPELSACVRCNTCDGHPCLVHAKADAEVIGIRPVMDLPNVTLITNAEVQAVLPNQSYSRAIGVAAMVDGESKIFYGDRVILAAGAVNTAKILLNSGVANSSDQVGRNYMFHNSRAVLVIDRKPNSTVFQKTLGINDFYLPGNDASRWPLGNIQMVGKSCAAAMRGEKPALTKLAPDMTLEQIARHSVDFWLTTEDLPEQSNRVRLTSSGQVHLSYFRHWANDGEARLLYRSLRQMLDRIGMGPHLDLSSKMGMSAVAHQAGTCRMGVARETSVVDENLQAHDLDNLYIADASVFPSIGAVNPALTVMALALRLGDRLAG